MAAATVQHQLARQLGEARLMGDRRAPHAPRGRSPLWSQRGEQKDGVGVDVAFEWIGVVLVFFSLAPCLQNITANSLDFFQ